MKRISLLLICLLVLAVPMFAADEPKSTTPKTDETPKTDAPNPGCSKLQGPEDVMKDCCKAQMDKCCKMKEGMEASDKKIDELLAEVKKEKGNKKTEALSQLVEELVAQNKMLKDLTMKQIMGDQHMKMHMMMAMGCTGTDCPMMKTAGDKPGCQPGCQPGCPKAGEKSDKPADPKMTGKSDKPECTKASEKTEKPAETKDK